MHLLILIINSHLIISVNRKKYPVYTEKNRYRGNQLYLFLTIRIRGLDTQETNLSHLKQALRLTAASKLYYSYPSKAYTKLKTILYEIVATILLCLLCLYSCPNQNERAEQ